MDMAEERWEAMRRQETEEFWRELEHFRREEAEKLEEVRYQNTIMFANLLELTEDMPSLRNVLDEQYGAVLEADREYCDVQSELEEQMKAGMREQEEEEW